MTYIYIYIYTIYIYIIYIYIIYIYNYIYIYIQYIYIYVHNIYICIHNQTCRSSISQLSGVCSFTIEISCLAPSALFQAGIDIGWWPEKAWPIPWSIDIPCGRWAAGCGWIGWAMGTIAMSQSIANICINMVNDPDSLRKCVKHRQNILNLR